MELAVRSRVEFEGPRASELNWVVGQVEQVEPALKLPQVFKKTISNRHILKRIFLFHRHCLGERQTIYGIYVNRASWDCSVVVPLSRVFFPMELLWFWINRTLSLPLAWFWLGRRSQPAIKTGWLHRRENRFLGVSLSGNIFECSSVVYNTTVL